MTLTEVMRKSIPLNVVNLVINLLTALAWLIHPRVPSYGLRYDIFDLDKHTDRHKNERTQPNALSPCFVVDN